MGTGDRASARAGTDDAETVDVTAFIREYDSRMRWYVARLLPGPNGVLLDDVLQATYEQLWLASPCIPASSAFAYCLPVARHLAVREARRRARDLVIEVDDNHLGLAPDPAELVIRAERHRRTARLLRAVLPSRQFAVVVAVDLAGCSYAEAGRTLNMSTEAVRAALSRGRRTLRRYAAEIGEIAVALPLGLRRLVQGHHVAWWGGLGCALISWTLILVPDARPFEPGMPPAAAVAVPAVGWSTRDETSPHAAAANHVVGDGRAGHGRVDVVDAGAGRAGDKLAGCLTPDICYGRRGREDKHTGHGVWVRIPGSTSQGTYNEVSQRWLPLCDVVDHVPEQQVTGCNRHGPTGVPNWWRTP